MVIRHLDNEVVLWFTGTGLKTTLLGKATQDTESVLLEDYGQMLTALNSGLMTTEEAKRLLLLQVVKQSLPTNGMHIVVL
tara:strand:+ start:5563 stop:5802 length:240 start_codon:yes stop_codon:yes gene_type:complete